MTGGKFFPRLDVNSDGEVLAGGPLENLPDQVVEMCVWVYQRTANGSDAIANAMDDGPGLKKKMAMPGADEAKPSALKIEKTREDEPMWSLKLDDRMNAKGKFTKGSANAVALGVFLDDKGKERFFLWSEQVMLGGAGTNPAAAKRASAKRGSTKRAPMKGMTTKRASAKRASG